MKKHPVDDLFKRRLIDLDKKPSENAWLKIQQTTETRRKPALWIWYAAASIAIALTAGYAVWQNSVIPEIGNQKSVALTKKTERITPIGKVYEKESKPVEIASHIEEVPNKMEPLKPEKEKKEIKYSHAPVQKLEEPREKPTIANTEKMPVIQNSLASTDSQKVPETTTLLLDRADLQDTNTVKAEVTMNERPIKIVVAVESNEDQLEEKPKTSRFSKVFRQLKNARAGEKVDWEEVGFNPKNLVARVDDRLRTKEGRASEKNQNPKERTKL